MHSRPRRGGTIETSYPGPGGRGKQGQMWRRPFLEDKLCTPTQNVCQRLWMHLCWRGIPVVFYGCISLRF